MSIKVPKGHICEAPGCSEPAPRGATCGPRCRRKKWGIDNNYRDPRRRRCGRGPSKPRRHRYAIVEVRGSSIEVLGFDVASSKRAVLKAFGIVDHPSLTAIAARHLPV